MIEKLKKILSFLLIFLTLFNISFQLTLEPFLRGASAGNAAYSDLVTVFVEDAVWRSGARGVINRYANDVTNNLENTQVVLVPVPVDATPFKIASINEKFYFEGRGGDRNLVGSVFIGDIPIPVVHDNDDFSRTVFPYVDFREKAYVYNQISEKYEKNEKRLGEIKAEIWHGFISPNSSEYSKVEGIINYFEKNHAFYAGEAPFDPLNGIMTGNKDAELDPEYEPEIFYFDQVRESDSINYSNYKGYLAYQNNKEDLIYNRFTKPFAEYLQTQVLGKDQDDVTQLLEDVATANEGGAKAGQAGELIAAIAEMDAIESNGLSNPNVGDIQARNTILDVGKKFVEIFAPGMTGQSRTHVRNTGRYSNTGSAVHMDSIPFLVSHLDSITDSLIKSVNTKLEGEIDGLVMTGGLSRNIAVPTKMAHLHEPEFGTGGPGYVDPSSVRPSEREVNICTTSYKEFTNFLDGRKGNYINTAKDCSAYLGNSSYSGQLVEANRGLNVKHVAKSAEGGTYEGNGNPTGDITEYLRFHEIEINEGDSYKDRGAEMCATNESENTYGYWGGNTPLNMNFDTEDVGERMLKLHEGTDIGSSITTVHDVVGGHLIENESDPDFIPEYPSIENDFYVNEIDKNPNPMQCLDNNFILTRSIGEFRERFLGGIDYADDANVYLDNMTYWNNEENIPITEADGSQRVYNVANPEGGFHRIDIGEQTARFCTPTYNLPMIKPAFEFQELYGTEAAFATGAISFGLGGSIHFNQVAGNSQIPITADEVIIESEFDGGGTEEIIPPLFNEVVNWGCDSRNVKMKLDFTFDHVYRLIEESEGDACNYTTAFMYGEEDVFIPIGEGEGTLIDEKFSLLAEGAFDDVTLSGAYLTGAYYEDLGFTGSLIVPQSSTGETVIGELVKSNIVVTHADLDVDDSEEGTGLAPIDSCEKDIVNYFYKEIPSFIEHKSPEPFGLYSQIKHKVTPNLAIDKDRYIDFIAANNTYQKILYPYLFRVEMPIEFETQEGTLDEKLLLVDEEIKKILDEKSEEINEIIINSDPVTLTDPIDLEIYEHLKIAEYSDEEIDLYQILQEIEPVEIESFLDIKEVNYYDFLVFSIYWNNLASVPAKYKFVMEQYLSDQYQRPELEFLVPKNKKFYEMAYLGAAGTAQEMYVSLDPEAKGDHPFSEIIYDNVELGTQLFSSNVFENDGQGADFKCAPPEGVPLWEWPSALSCWLQDFQKPGISFGENSCSQKTLFLTEEEQEEARQCNGDFNKNGVEDCLEERIPGGNLELYANSPVHFYNSTGKVTVVLNDGEGNPIKIDNTSRINLELVNIVARDGEEIFNESEYVVYNFVDTRNSYGEANFYFTGKDKDVDLFFKASLELKDSNGEVFAAHESEEIKVEIRGDRLFATSYKVSEEESDIGLQIGQDTLVVSDATNIFVSDELENPVTGKGAQLLGASAAKEKMVLSLSNYDNDGKNVEVNYPVTVRVFQGIDEFEDDVDQLYGEYSVGGASDMTPLLNISEAGFYRFVILDANGVEYSRVVELIPDVASRMELNLSTNVSETRGVHTPHLFTLYDQYDNVANSEFYTVNATINGTGVRFDDLTKEKSFTTYEGFKAFKLISEDGGGQSSLSFEVDGVNATQNFYVVEDINLTVEPQFEELMVGGGIYSYNVTIDGAGTGVENLNTSLYVSSNTTYLEPLSPFFNITNGIAEVKIITKKSSGIDVPIEFQAYGLRDSYRENQTILHEVPIKIDISLNNDKIEASPESFAILTVELKDRFGNVAFTDNGSSVDLELQDKVARFFTPEDIDTPHGEHLGGGGDESIIITPDSLSNTVIEGRTTFKLYGTEEPGLSYFKVGVPSIAGSSFIVNGQAPFSAEDLEIEGFSDGGNLSTLGASFFDDLGGGELRSKYLYLNDLQGSADYGNLPAALADQLSAIFEENNQLTITGVGENAGMIETYYYWKADTLKEKFYNALYTTMIGSNYGDISEPDYLAGAVLFEAENRGLAVTSLLQNPYKTDGVFRIGKQSSLRKVASNEDLAQDVVPSLVLTEESTRVTLNNQAININIGDVYYNFDAGTTELKTCEIGIDLDACSVDGESSEIILREVSTLYNAIQRDDELQLLNTSGEEIFSINVEGIIQKDIGVQTTVDFDSREKFLKIDIATADGEAGILLFHFNDDAELFSTKDSSRLAGLNSIGNSIVFHLKTNYYETKILQDTGIEISYRDLFNSSKSLENFVEDTPYGYEKFETEVGLGFTGTNKTLLGFAAGKSVGESTKDYHSFYMINLGDPVVSLKKIAKNIPFTETPRNFDSTLGEIVSREDGILDYSFGDYNNDGREDIFLQKNTGYVQLLENTPGATKFMNRGNLLYIADISSSSTVQAGDFDGNGFSDVFMINTKGQPAIFMNDEKKFTRYDLEEQFELNGKVTQAEVFDMDNNGQHDVVLVDESGQINIFYGGGSATEPSFTKRTIEEGIGATLLEDARNDGAALYFDGLPQSSGNNSFEALSQSQQELLNQQNGLLAESLDEKIDFAAYCQLFQECLNKIVTFRGLKPTFTEPADACKRTPVCLNFAIQEAIDDAIIEGDQHGYLSQEELQGAVFIDLPYQTSELYNEELSELSNGDISELVSSNFPIFSEPTHPDVQAGVDFTNAEISSYISEAIPETIDYNGELNYTQNSTFIRSEYSESAGLRVEKFYSDNDGGYLKSGDNVEAKIVITNIGEEEKTNIAFVDTIPAGFIIDKGKEIFSSIDGLDMKNGVGAFDYMFEGFSLAPGEEVRFVFGLIAPPIRIGYMEVGIFEDAGGGNDGQGDVKIKSAHNTCGAVETLYMSAGYGKTEEEPSCDTSNISEELDEHLTDEDENGVPDYIDELLEGGEEATVLREEYAKEQLDKLDFDSDLDGLPDREDDSPYQNTNDASFVDDLEELDEKAAEASEQIDTLIEGLGCGFGGGGCIASPLNWAPLAPGNDPTLFGMPVGDGLRVKEGIPVFSALTGVIFPIIGCIPFIWPLSPLDLSAGCGGLGAGGYLGVDSPANFIRIFVTPTLTGAVGVAICFGGPASVVGRSNPPGVHPLIPGGNCIVTASPMPLCSNDGSDGDPSYIGRPEATLGSDYSVIGGNCELSNPILQQINPELVSAYLNSSDWTEFRDTHLGLIENGVVAQGEHWGNIDTPPLIQGGAGDLAFDFGFSITNEDGLVFQDVQKVNMKKVFPFPDFLAGWLDRQIGEISDKLTDFPSLFIILPDMSGFMQSGWGNFSEGLKEHFVEGKKLYDEDELAAIDTIARLENQKEGLNCDNPETTASLRCSMLDIRITKLQRDNGIAGGITTPVKTVVQKGRKYMSGIRAAYQFLSSLPLISVEPEKVLVTIPWADEATLSRAIIDRKETKKQWERELGTAGDEFRNLDENFDLNANKLLSSLDRNIEIIKHYMELPSELNKLLRTKELRLEQITCNIEALNEMLNGRIDRNGKRFKAWVELYITIKAILKSWQLIVDIFYEYDAACHDCKNERQDLYYFAFKLISIVIPEIPVIQFPRWPDVILDLHNIRAGIVVSLPDIEIRPRPIVLPPLPNLYLPSIPSVAINLPELPLLDDYSLPELPELPSLPVADLPDLPPPPHLPKLFAELEGMLSILKLVTKVMCILKSSPFVPEWRAGDQIAFITERTGYIPTDFLDLSFPQFTYPFVDALKVSTYVNFEYETDFLVEATRSALLPFNNFTSEVSKKINRRIPDFNLEKYQLDDVNINIDGDGEVELETRLSDDADFATMMGIVTSGIQELVHYIDENAQEEVNSKYFTKLANESLNKEWIIKDPKYNDLRGLWQSVQDYDYEEEEKFIKTLKERNNKKFETLQNIIENEKRINTLQKQEFKEFSEKKLSYKNPFTLAADTSERFSRYQTQLDVYNSYSQASFVNMLEGGNIEQEKLKEIAEDITVSVQKGFKNHTELLAKTDPKRLFADHHSSGGAAAVSGGTCEASKADHIMYKGIYILEETTPYRLFDYTEEIRGDEEHRYLDYDNDGDQDIMYMMNGVIYLKENLEATAGKIYIGSVETTNFEEMDEKFEAINGFREVVENGFVNITFNAHSNRNINAYRLEFYDRIDAFDSEETLNPPEYQKVIVDAFSRVDELTTENENDFYTTRENIGRVTNASIAPGLEVEVDEVVDLRSLLIRNNIVQISKGTKLYTGGGSGGIRYYNNSDDTKEEKALTLAGHSNVEFHDNIVIVGVSGSIYAKTKLRRIYRGGEVIDLVRLPLLENTVVRLEEEGRQVSGSNMEIIYYDDTELGLDFSILKKYELLDLGPEQEVYHIKTSIENSFYYARFGPFLSNEFGTKVRTVLMSPQNEIDSTPPELDYSTFRIPVYKERVFDLTPYIYDDAGIRGIKEMYIDTDLEVDSDGNGDPADDRLLEGDDIRLERTLTSVKLRFGPYDEIFVKNFKVIMIDENDNIGEAIVDMEVYAPIPDITYGDTSEVRGLLRENIDEEPITLFRYRGGVLSKLRDVLGADTISTGFNGDFQFNFPVEEVEEEEEGKNGEEQTEGGSSSGEGSGSSGGNGSSGGGEGSSSSGGGSENTLTIRVTGETNSIIATVNGNTGKISVVDPLAGVEVLASNDINNNTGDVLFVLKKGGEEVYTQTLKITGGYNQVVPNFENIDVEGLYIKLGDSEIYGYYQIPDDAEYSAGAVVIYYLDNPYEALFTIHKNGDIYVKDDNYRLEYSTYNDYIVLNLIDAIKKRRAGEVLIKPGQDFRLQ